MSVSELPMRPAELIGTARAPCLAFKHRVQCSANSGFYITPILLAQVQSHQILDSILVFRKLNRYFL
jgi:hypothetical protein